MKPRSREYFKECRRGKKAIADGGYWVRIIKPVILLDGSFAEQRKWRKNYRSQLKFPVSPPFPIIFDMTEEKDYGTYDVTPSTNTVDDLIDNIPLKDFLDYIEIKQPDGTYSKLTKWQKDKAMCIPGANHIVKSNGLPRTVNLNFDVSRLSNLWDGINGNQGENDERSVATDAK